MTYWYFYKLVEPHPPSWGGGGGILLPGFKVDVQIFTQYYFSHFLNNEGNQFFLIQKKNTFSNFSHLTKLIINAFYFLLSNKKNLFIFIIVLSTEKEFVITL